MITPIYNVTNVIKALQRYSSMLKGDHYKIISDALVTYRDASRETNGQEYTAVKSLSESIRSIEDINLIYSVEVALITRSMLTLTNNHVTTKKVDICTTNKNGSKGVIVFELETGVTQEARDHVTHLCTQEVLRQKGYGETFYYSLDATDECFPKKISDLRTTDTALSSPEMAVVICNNLLEYGA